MHAAVPVGDVDARALQQCLGESGRRQRDARRLCSSALMSTGIMGRTAPSPTGWRGSLGRPESAGGPTGSLALGLPCGTRQGSQQASLQASARCAVPV